MSKTAGPKWKQQNRTWHPVTPPSGMSDVEVRIPSLTELIRAEGVPDRLRALALKAAAHPGGMRGVMAEELVDANKQIAEAEDQEKATADLVEKDAGLRQALDDVVEIQKHLITQSVRVGGELLTIADLDDPDFPAPDAEWFGAVMLREESYDARGVRLGIEPLDAWGRFRDFHDCGPDCGACAALQDEFSSADLGVV
jgi:hypothetical protein